MKWLLRFEKTWSFFIWRKQGVVPLSDKEYASKVVARLIIPLCEKDHFICVISLFYGIFKKVFALYYVLYQFLQRFTVFCKRYQKIRKIVPEQVMGVYEVILVFINIYAVR